MRTHPMKMVTVIVEALAEPALLKLLEEVGAHGYTLGTVAGSGAKGERPADIEDFANIKLEVILQEAAAATLLDRLWTEFFPRFSMIAYETDIRVLRREKF